MRHSDQGRTPDERKRDMAALDYFAAFIFWGCIAFCLALLFAP